MGIGDPFPGTKRGRGVRLTTHPHIVPRSRMISSYTSSPLKRLRCVSWECCTFLQYSTRDKCFLLTRQIWDSATFVCSLKLKGTLKDMGFANVKTSEHTTTQKVLMIPELNLALFPAVGSSVYMLNNNNLKEANLPSL